MQFNISSQFSSICSTDRTLSGAITPDLSEPGSDGNDGVLCIPGTSSSDCLVSYQGRSLGVLPLSRHAVGVFGSTNQLGKLKKK